MPSCVWNGFCRKDCFSLKTGYEWCSRQAWVLHIKIGCQISVIRNLNWTWTFWYTLLQWDQLVESWGKWIESSRWLTLHRFSPFIVVSQLLGIHALTKPWAVRVETFIPGLSALGGVPPHGLYLPEIRRAHLSSPVPLSWYIAEDAKMCFRIGFFNSGTENWKRAVRQIPLPWRLDPLAFGGKEGKMWAGCAEFSQLLHKVGAASLWRRMDGD